MSLNHFLIISFLLALISHSSGAKGGFYTAPPQSIYLQEDEPLVSRWSRSYYIRDLLSKIFPGYRGPALPVLETKNNIIGGTEDHRLQSPLKFAPQARIPPPGNNIPYFPYHPFLRNRLQPPPLMTFRFEDVIHPVSVPTRTQSTQTTQPSTTIATSTSTTTTSTSTTTPTTTTTSTTPSTTTTTTEEPDKTVRATFLPTPSYINTNPWTPITSSSSPQLPYSPFCPFGKCRYGFNSPHKPQMYNYNPWVKAPIPQYIASPPTYPPPAAYYIIVTSDNNQPEGSFMSIQDLLGVEKTKVEGSTLLPTTTEPKEAEKEEPLGAIDSSKIPLIELLPPSSITEQAKGSEDSQSPANDRENEVKITPKKPYTPDLPLLQVYEDEKKLPKSPTFNERVNHPPLPFQTHRPGLEYTRKPPIFPYFNHQKPVEVQVEPVEAQPEPEELKINKPPAFAHPPPPLPTTLPPSNEVESSTLTEISEVVEVEDDERDDAYEIEGVQEHQKVYDFGKPLYIEEVIISKSSSHDSEEHEIQ